MEIKKVSTITDVKDYFSEKIVNVHIVSVLKHFRTINKVLMYKARFYIGRQYSGL